ncbi:hypothetical protein [Thioalkalivibrio sp. AKL9]|uniref:hypothetical protein n=1 Tax=Thioalkalivibrio sp. AKL9 TaxID=1158157 RepID=UPI00037D99A9|nr:hypothetical protein [Thioalkalivibrio sp. AKL9]
MAHVQLTYEDAFGVYHGRKLQFPGPQDGCRLADIHGVEQARRHVHEIGNRPFLMVAHEVDQT